MVEITLDPILARWGSITLSWHGLCLATGILVLYVLVARQAKHAGLTREALSELALWVLAAGFAGARLLHVFQQWSTYVANPLRILAVYEGGLTVNGAVCGGLLAAIVYARRKRIPIWKLTDLMVLAAPLAFIVGRVGCLINGDVAGLPTNASWGLVYHHPDAIIPARWLGVPTFPAPIALQLWNVGLYLLLRLLHHRQPADGILTAAYLVFYGLGRFLINIWQPGPAVALGFKYLQIVALGLMVLGAMLALCRHAGRQRLPGRQNPGLPSFWGSPSGDQL